MIIPLLLNSTFQSSTILATGTAIGSRNDVLNSAPRGFTKLTKSANERLNTSKSGMQIPINFVVLYAASLNASLDKTEV